MHVTILCCPELLVMMLHFYCVIVIDHYSITFPHVSPILTTHSTTYKWTCTQSLNLKASMVELKVWAAKLEMQTKPGVWTIALQALTDEPNK